MLACPPRDLPHRGRGLPDGLGKPEMVATDNASYSDMVFSRLGYNFSPRFKDLTDQRFWRADLPGISIGGYGPLEALARNKVT
jgi:hypothetical protein